MKQKTRARIVFAAILIGYIAFFAFYCIERLRNLPYPYGFFTFLPPVRFTDFYDVNKMMITSSPYLEGTSSYPPFVFVIAKFFSWFGDYEHVDTALMFGTTEGKIAIALFLVIFWGIFFGLLFVIFKKAGVFKNTVECVLMAGALSLSAPMIYTMDRGNYLLPCLGFWIGFLFFYEKNDTLAAVFLGLACAFKIYPLFMVLLLIADKKWKQIGVMCVTILVVSIGPMYLFQGTLFENIKELLYILFFWGQGDGGGAEFSYTYFGVGLSPLLRFLLMWYHGTTQIADTSVPIGKIYLIFGTLLTGWTFWRVTKETSFWKKAFVLGSLMVFLTPNSYYYNLTYMIPIVALYLLDEKERPVWLDVCYLVLMIINLIPITYHYVIADCMISSQIFFNAMSLLAGVVVYNIFDKSTVDGERKFFPLKAKGND